MGHVLCCAVPLLCCAMLSPMLCFSMQAQLKASVDGGFKAQQASIMLTHEFDL